MCSSPPGGPAAPPVGSGSIHRQPSAAPLPGFCHRLTVEDEHDEAEEMLQMAEAKVMKVYELLGIDPLQMDGVDLEENALEAAQFDASNTEGPVDPHRHRPTSRCAVPAKEEALANDGGALGRHRDLHCGRRGSDKKNRALCNRYTSVTKEEDRAALAASSAARRPEARPS